MIAAAFSSGPLLFSAHQGRNNSQTFWYFLLQLAHLLQKTGEGWKERYLLVLDNVSFHRSRYLMEKLQKFQLPVHFLGPYSFQAAPVEQVFAFMKQEDLGPTLLNRRLAKEELLQEVALQIQKKEYPPMQSLFRHCLKALEEQTQE